MSTGECTQCMDFSNLFKGGGKRKGPKRKKKSPLIDLNGFEDPAKAEEQKPAKKAPESEIEEAKAADPEAWEAKESAGGEEKRSPEQVASALGTGVPGKFMVHFRPHYGWLKRLKAPAVLKSCTCPRFAATPFREDLCHCGYPEPMHPRMNIRVFKGWQQQRGNNCAAAGIAGVVNALLGVGSSDPRAATLQEAVDTYDEMLRETVESTETLLRKRIPSEFERISSSLRALDLAKIDRKAERRVLRAEFRKEVATVEEAWTEEVARVLAEAGLPVYRGADAGGGSGADEDAEGALDQREKDAEEAAGDEDDGGADAGTPTPSPGTDDLGAAKAVAWRMTKAAGELPDGVADQMREINIAFQARLAQLRRSEDLLRKWWHKLWGRNRMQRLRSTAVIGNMHILQGASRLASKRGAEVDAMTLFNKGKTKRGTVTKKDQQWALLCEWFGDPHSVLLFHLTNHYALVFGTREYTDPDSGTVERHILTARAGQEPKSWLSWDQCRKELLKWQGYSMLAFRLRRD